MRMEDELEMVYNEITGAYEQRKKPYAVIECPTEADFDKAKNALDAYDKHQWISVSDRLPELGKEVLICTKAKNGSRNIDKGYWYHLGFVHRGKAEVTHWMPMPEPPK